ncbi:MULTISPECIES: ABC transporter substrate-binding protein [unclassified Mesorhizobium]|uniref:ABC transporter substrate-binding protein n=1 Tax=unclassified Mesorhizobium TaxID=325217 RepID=UPI000FCAD6C3|nr:MULTISPECIES: ABC transporter substrate-binding protein [unclassified Mesorhizobium]TIT80415.1 MAG: extracellular solute-binding protein [Mesorhizobium sp.]TGP22940.1 ABC transporter substrate-binding protein [Mesorhizobium sp. M1D.F.Ca.ET.231.01.1.1]TGP32002.1 ABC transporter substrate-binding protein [Mesorhizobium sp. M1D.F.Ca.ET.234.01.1.1]TGS46465.1 ABC transporter substrate-binding protein [Mesorhizobium sp. M1D.F.Ca.ET.184.01.1.1]TGS61292.1 ABC transporter substrate-binding protein [
MTKLFHISSLILALSAAAPALAQSVTITTAGGDYGTGMKEAMWAPAGKALGLDVRGETQSDGMAALRLQVSSGNVTTDIIHLASGEGAQAADLNLLEPLDEAAVDQKALPAGSASKFCYPFSSYGTVMAWNTKTYGQNGPKDWAEFWDVKKFPGRRALRANAQDLLEAALLSQGVEPGKVYDALSEPGGIKRAIDRLAELKPNVAVWWTSGAQSAQILKDGEADLVETWNGRAQSAKDDGGAVAYTFHSSIIGTDCLAVAKGAPHKEDAMKLIAAMTSPEREAKLTDYITYGPMNPAAYTGGKVPADKMALLATAPDNAVGVVYSNAAWWAKHGDEAQAAFDAMMNQ